MDKVKRQAKRTAVAIVGSIVLVIGIIMIPYPGPGWLGGICGIGDSIDGVYLGAACA